MIINAKKKKVEVKREEKEKGDVLSIFYSVVLNAKTLTHNDRRHSCLVTIRKQYSKNGANCLKGHFSFLLFCFALLTGTNLSKFKE